MKFDENVKRKKNLTAMSLTTKNKDLREKNSSKDRKLNSQDKVHKDVFDIKRSSVSNFSSRCHEKDRNYQKFSPISKRLEFDVFENKLLKNE